MYYSAASTLALDTREVTTLCGKLRNVFTEPTAHLAYETNISFVPPSSGLTLSSDAFFTVPKDNRDILGHQTLPSILKGDFAP